MIKQFNKLRIFLLSLNRLSKQLIEAFVDFFIISISIMNGASLSNIDFKDYTFMPDFIWIPAVSILIFYIFGVYRSIVRHISLSYISLLVYSLITAFLLNALLRGIYLSVFEIQSSSTFKSIVSYDAWLISFLTSFSLLVLVRVLANSFLRSDLTRQKKVVIYGAGAAGIQLANALNVTSEMKPVAFVDSNPALRNKYLGDLKIYSPSRLRKLSERGEADEVLIAIPSASRNQIKKILKEVENYPLKVRILPGLAELAQGKVTVSELKEIDLSDLLSRQEVIADKDLLKRNIENKSVLITGAGGSIGSELAKQVLKSKPKNLILLDSSELALYEINKDLIEIYPEAEILAFLGSVSDKDRLKDILSKLDVDTIYHAAAYKHVPIVEENPFEAIKNNIFGTLITLKSALENEVETFVLISTDKAVRPANIMGATKRFAEMILQSLAKDEKYRGTTNISMVRFGNVIGSSGSAVPLFQKQIRDGGPVTVTDSEIIRYFMTIQEAAQLVIQAGSMGKSGDIFVLDMGEPVKVLDLAKRLIKLSGKEVRDDNNPDGDIDIIFTGLRAGEKLYEELLIGGDSTTTEHPRIFKAKEAYIEWEELEKKLEKIVTLSKNSDNQGLSELFSEIISGYSQNGKISDLLFKQKE